jgi:hypothetical protein
VDGTNFPADRGEFLVPERASNASPLFLEEIQTMTSQNPTKPDVEILTIAQDDAQAAIEQGGIKSELSDEELASVAGGNTGTTKTGLPSSGGFKSGPGGNTYSPY